MKKIAVLGLALILPAFAFGLDGYEVASKSYNVETGKTAFFNATLTLKTKKGATRVREISLRKKEFGDSKKTLISFSAPKDVEGVAYLSFDYTGKSASSKESESWLYMPAMKKVRRINGSSRQDDFMGSDFTYEDIGDRGLDKDDFNLLAEESAEGFDCYKVECVAKDKGEKIPRRVIWVRKDNYLLQKAEFYDQRGDLQRVLVCSDIKQVNGIWTIQKMVMTNVQTEHSSVMELKAVQYNQDLPDNIFTVSYIGRGTAR